MAAYLNVGGKLITGFYPRLYGRIARSDVSSFEELCCYIVQHMSEANRPIPQQHYSIVLIE